MATSYVFDHVKLLIAKGELKFYNIPADGFRLALVTSAAFDNFATGAFSDYMYWNQVSGSEINAPGSGYNYTGYTGPESLINNGTLEEDVDGFTQLKVSASDIAYPISTIEADGAVVYKNDAQGTLVTAIHFGEKKSSNNGSFIIDLSTDGWIRIH